MQTFVHKPALISLALIVAAGTARAGDLYVQTNLVSDMPGMGTSIPPDPNLKGAWGLSFSTTSPFWVSDQAANFNGSGATTVYKVSDTTIPTSLRSAVGRGSHEPGERSPESQHDQWSNGPGEHRRTGDHHGLDGFPCRHFQGRLHFRQS